MKQKNDQQKVKNSKTKKHERVLALTLYALVLILITAISFVGIYSKNLNSVKNLLPDYKLGTDLYGARNIVIKTAETEEDEKVSAEVDYKKVKEIIVGRLNSMKLSYYEIKCNETDGTIYLEVPEDSNADYAAQYAATKGEFKVSYSDNDEALLTNKDIE